MNFGQALEAAKRGSLISRLGWNGKGQYVAIQVPDEASKNTLPYLWIRNVASDRVPWVASQSDLLADDWVEIGAVS